MSENSRAKVIKNVEIDGNLLRNRLSEKDLIITYANENGKILAKLNKSYIETLNLEIDSLASFWIHFEGAQSVKQEIDMQFESFEKLFSSTTELLEILRINLQEDIKKWEIAGREGEKELDIYYSNRPIVTKDFLRQTLVFILNNMKSKDKLLDRLKTDREKERQEAKDLAKINQKVKFSEEFLFHLNHFQKALNERKIEEISEKFDFYRDELNGFSIYSDQIKKIEMLLKDKENVNLDRVKKESQNLIQIFDDFRRIFEDLSHFYADLNYRHECLKLIKKKHDLFIEYTECKVVNKYYEAEVQYWLHKKTSTNDKYVICQSNDKLTQMKRVSRNISDQITYLNSDIQSISLSGQIGYTVMTQSFPHHCDRSSTENNHNYFINVSSDFRLIKNITEKNIVKPDHYEESKETVENRRILEKFEAKYEEVYSVFIENADKIAKYERIEIEILQIFEKIKIEKGQKFEKLTIQLNAIKEFLLSLRNLPFKIDQALIPALISALIKNMNVRLKPGCCSFAPKLFTVTNIKPDDFYLIFFKVLIENNKIEKSCCCNNVLSLVYDCVDIELEDLKSLLIVPEVLVALKNSQEGSQQLNQGILIENCTLSICKIVKESSKIICLKKSLNLKIDEARSKSYIRLSQEMLTTILIKNKYNNLARAIEKYEYEI